MGPNPTALTGQSVPRLLGTILAIILIIFRAGGFSGRFGGYGYGYRYGYGHGGVAVIGAILIIVVVLILTGRL